MATKIQKISHILQYFPEKISLLKKKERKSRFLLFFLYICSLKYNNLKVNHEEAISIISHLLNVDEFSCPKRGERNRNR